MTPLIAFLIVQTPLTVRQVEAEDAEVIGVALVNYWKVDPMKPGTLYISDLTDGPTGPSGGIIDQGWDRTGKPLPKIETDASLRKSLIDRNAYPISISGMKFLYAPIKAIKQKSSTARGSISRSTQLPHLQLPGYSNDRKHAIVCLGFPEGLHVGQASIWLTKTGGIWKVTHIRESHLC